MSDIHAAQRSCVASSKAWRREAGELRDLARGRHLRESQRQRLLREAEAAERQADYWIAGAREYPLPADLLPSLLE